MTNRKMTVRTERGKFVLQGLVAVIGFLVAIATLSGYIGIVYSTYAAIVVVLLLWIISYHVLKSETDTKTKPAVTPPMRGSASAMRTREQIPPSLHSVCEVGPYKVEAGEILNIPLNAKQGQKVKGHLEEVDGQPFDWYIADEKT